MDEELDELGEDELREKLSEVVEDKAKVEKKLGLYNTTKEDYLDKIQSIFDLDDIDFSNKASYQGGGKSAIRKSGLRKIVEQSNEEV